MFFSLDHTGTHCGKLPLLAGKRNHLKMYINPTEHGLHDRLGVQTANVQGEDSRGFRDPVSRSDSQMEMPWFEGTKICTEFV